MQNDNANEFHGLNINFDLSGYERDQEGLIQHIEDARSVIRNLHNIVLYLGNYAFEGLPTEHYAEISRYLVGTYLLSHGKDQKDPQQEKGIALLRTLLGDEFDQVIRLHQGQEEKGSFAVTPAEYEATQLEIPAPLDIHDQLNAKEIVNAVEDFFAYLNKDNDKDKN